MMLLDQLYGPDARTLAGLIPPSAEREWEGEGYVLALMIEMD